MIVSNKCMCQHDHSSLNFYHDRRQLSQACPALVMWPVIEDKCAIAIEVCKGDVGWCCFSGECGDFDDVGDAVLMACKLFDS